MKNYITVSYKLSIFKASLIMLYRRRIGELEAEVSLLSKRDKEDNDDKKDAAEDDNDKFVTVPEQPHTRHDTPSDSPIPVESGSTTITGSSLETRLGHSNSEQLQRTERLTADDEANETKNEDEEQGMNVL